jgi:beta-N-acetylglucosaminidase
MAEETKLNIKVALDSKNFQKGVNDIQGGFKRLNGTINSFKTAFVGTAVFGVIKGLTDIAGQAEKTELRFKRVFGSMSTEVSSFSSSLASSLGRVDTDVQSGLVSFQAFFQGLGFGGKEAAAFSMKMQGLSYDLASFFNIADDNAQKRFIAALAGSPEVLDQFGINLKQAAIQEELYRMGLKSTVQTTNEMVKTQARLNIIMEAMTSNGIVGDAERTMFTWDNTVKRTTSSLKELGINIGTALIPISKAFLEVVISLTDGLIDFFTSTHKNVQENRDLQQSFKKNTEQLLSYGRETNLFRLKLAELTKTYPNFLGKLDATKASQKQLEDRVKLLNDQFIKQERILSGQNAFDKQREKIKDYEAELLSLADAISENEVAQPKAGKKIISRGEVAPYSEKGVTEADIAKEAIRLAEEKIKYENLLSYAIVRTAEIQSELTKEVESTGKAYQDVFGTIVKQKEEIIKLGKTQAEQDKEELDRQKELYNYIKGNHDIIAYTIGLKSKSLDQLSDEGRELERQKNFFEELIASGLEYGDALETVLVKQAKLNHQLAKMSQFEGYDAPFKIDTSEFEGNVSKAKDSALAWIDILRPITDAASQLWTQMLTPPDGTISKEEQKEKTMAAFGGIMVGLGQALFSLGMGALLAHEGLKEALSGNVPAALIMMATGAGLISLGKGQLQKAKNSQFSREGGGSANSGGAGGQSMTDFMSAVQGEQVFRLAGNDLVTAINRSNTFQGTIGG